MKFRHARIVAFGMTRRKGSKARADDGMKALLSADTEVVTIVGKSWDLHVHEVLGVSEEENLAMIADSVRHCVAAGRTVIYDAEHFFDGSAANTEFAMRTILAAQEAGAACICLCDTNGGSMPEQIAERLEAVQRYISAPIGIHPHNDCGVAVANALAAVRCGAMQVQGTMNGIGERCGNVDLTAVIGNLALKYGHRVLPEGAVTKLTEMSRYVYEVANLIPAENQPFVGNAAFAHKGGMHVHAVRRVARSYEHITPELVGNTRKILISELSGASGVAEKIGRKLDVEGDKKLHAGDPAASGARARRVRLRKRRAASSGLRKELGLHRRFWQLDHWRSVILKTDANGDPSTEVIVKLRVDGEVRHHVAEGHGPVDSMATVMRKALRDKYPNVDQIRLIDYKVRVINPRAATAAKVRVTIEFLDEATHEMYGTVGVSENILEASWKALTDGLEYKLLSDEDRARKKPRPRARRR